jgi:hypothetical protein
MYPVMHPVLPVQNYKILFSSWVVQVFILENRGDAKAPGSAFREKRF